jgi:hypothetical protein
MIKDSRDPASGSAHNGPVGFDEGGDSACWVSDVCFSCGKIREDRSEEICRHCGRRVDGSDEPDDDSERPRS